MTENIADHLHRKLAASLDHKLGEALGPPTVDAGGITQTYKIAAGFRVPLSMLIDAGDYSPATMRMAEADGQWWLIGANRNPFPHIDPTPRCSAALQAAALWRERAIDAWGVLLHGLPDSDDDW